MHSPAASPFWMIGGAWVTGVALAMLVLVLTDRSPDRLIRASGVLTLSSLLFLAGLAQVWQVAQEQPRTVRLDPHRPACPPDATGCGTGDAHTSGGPSVP